MATSASLPNGTKLQQNRITISQLLNKYSVSLPNSTKPQQTDLTVSQLLNKYSASLPISTELEKKNLTVLELLDMCIDQLQSPTYLTMIYHGTLNPVWEYRAEKLEYWRDDLPGIDQKSLDDCITDPRIKEEILDLLYHIWDNIVDLDGYLKESDDRGIRSACCVISSHISTLEELSKELRELLNL